MIPQRPYRLLLNRHHGTPGVVVLPEGGYRRARAEIISWPGYAPTPLLGLEDVAAAARVASLHWKDESARFGLGSFKALGGAYAVARLLVGELARRGVVNAATTKELEAGAHRDAVRAITVTCATDGNHGRSVAWGARRFGASCVIFVHEGVSEGRRAAIARYGAEIRVVPGTYDDAVRACTRMAEQEAWFVVSDTSWEGYNEIPRDVMQGYRLLTEECLAAMPAPPTHVFVPGGVGGVAAAASVQLRAARIPAKLVVVEPENAACLLASAEAGRITAVEGELDTLMAGLACGEPSLLAWQELERAAFAYMALQDASAVDAMRLLAARTPPIVAGESAAPVLAAFLLAAAEPMTRAMLGLDVESRVLLLGTEGATDAALYATLTAASG
jgi:diaminopropionate ammonia-lyase